MYYYFTATKSPIVKQLTFDDLFIDSPFITEESTVGDTVTFCRGFIDPALVRKTNFAGMYRSLKSFNEKYKTLIETENKHDLYRSFKIPKRSGKLRQIDAPDEKLMCALHDLMNIFTYDFGAKYHTSAFAYVPKRCALDVVKKHQRNDSRWFLKTDLSNFFPSTTPEFLKEMMYRTYPFCQYVKYDGYKEELDRALSICFLDGGLPQGSPMSPMLTNIMMIPIDYQIDGWAHKRKPHLVYTRYADDMCFSSRYDFDWRQAVKELQGIFKCFGTPFDFNADKIHYGSRAGRNWILGVMLNKDNEISIGHEKKKVFKAMCHQFCMDTKVGTEWDLEDLQHFLGLIAYYRKVEESRTNEILAGFKKKFSLDIEKIVKQKIKDYKVVA